MNTKQKIGCTLAVVELLVRMPIWYYLIYSILKSIPSTEVMWLLFWIYVPVGFVLSFVQVMVKNILEGDE